jgi:hypothetical protein
MKTALAVVGTAALLSGCATARTERWEQTRLPEILGYRASPVVVILRQKESAVRHHLEEEQWKGPITSPTITRSWLVSDLDTTTCAEGPARHYDQSPIGPGGPVLPRDLPSQNVMGSSEYSVDRLDDGRLIALDRGTGARSVVFKTDGTIWSFTLVPAAHRIVIVTRKDEILVLDVEAHRVSQCRPRE